MPPSKEPRRREEKVRPFRPRPMRLSILTAALQELTPRERRDADPDLAIEEWLEFARALGCPNIELSAALHPTEADVPAAAMLDPVANTLDLGRPFTRERAARVERAMRASGVGLSDLAYFDNMLAADESVRRKKHASTPHALERGDQALAFRQGILPGASARLHSQSRFGAPYCGLTVAFLASRIVQHPVGERPVTLGLHEHRVVLRRYIRQSGL